MPRECKEPGYNQPHSARGWCRRHYRIHKELVGFGGQGLCSEGCGKPATTRGMCSSHYSKAARLGKLPGQSLCRFMDLDTQEPCRLGAIFRDGFCSKHHQRFKRYGDPAVTKRRANGEGWVSNEGYRVLQIGSRGKRRQVLEHRRVMAKHLRFILGLYAPQELTQPIKESA